jgi:hypothetical protein
MIHKYEYIIIECDFLSKAIPTLIFNVFLISINNKICLISLILIWLFEAVIDFTFKSSYYSHNKNKNIKKEEQWFMVWDIYDDKCLINLISSFLWVI